jgi:hypothetical protein
LHSFGDRCIVKLPKILLKMHNINLFDNSKISKVALLNSTFDSTNSGLINKTTNSFLIVRSYQNLKKVDEEIFAFKIALNSRNIPCLYKNMGELVLQCENKHFIIRSSSTVNAARVQQQVYSSTRELHT